jgi:hypothetical protein
VLKFKYGLNKKPTSLKWAFYLNSIFIILQ